MLSKKLISLIGFLIIFNLNLTSQNTLKDSLVAPLDTIRTDTMKVKYLNRTASMYIYSDPEVSEELLNLSVKISQNSKNLKGEGIAYIYLGSIYSYKSDFEKAIEVHTKGINVSKKAGFDAGCSENIYSIGMVYDAKGEFEKALQYYDSAYQYSWNLKDSINASRYLVGVGNIYIRRGLYGKALETYQTAQGIMEDIGYDHGVAICISNIGNIYLDQKEYDKALEAYIKGIEQYKKIGDLHGESVARNNIAAVYDALGKFEKSLKIYLEIAENYKLLNDEQNLSHTYSNIGVCYSELKQFDKAFLFLDKALVIQKKFGNKEEILLIYNKLGLAYKNSGDLTKAVIYSKRSLDLSLELQSLSRMKEAYENISDVYEKAGNHKKALAFYKSFKNIHDSIFNEENRKKLVQQEVKFEYEQKQKIAELEQKRKDDLHKAEIKQKNTLVFYVISALILVLIIAVIILRTGIQRKKMNNELLEKNTRINQQNDEILSQNEEIQAQRDQLQKSNDYIQAGINYARQIQNAVLPEISISTEIFDNFVFYRPKDVVSGDFYWIKQIRNYYCIVAADCTGHGVPGAFMSMLGISLLNENVTSRKLDNPGEILDALRKKIKIYLNQRGKAEEAKDGMDMALCLINTENLTAKFSGANNPLYLVRNKEVIEYKPTRNPIGIYLKEVNFETHSIQLQKDDMIYMFSDGYIDQFGGPKNKKFKAVQFKKLLTEISDFDTNKQKRIIEEIFEKWIGDNTQIDDILVMGMKIK